MANSGRERLKPISVHTYVTKECDATHSHMGDSTAYIRYIQEHLATVFLATGGLRGPITSFREGTHEPSSSAPRT